MTTLTLTLVGEGSALTVRYAPPLDFGNVPHEMALTALRTVNNVENVRQGCNTLTFSATGEQAGRTRVTLPTGTYTLTTSKRSSSRPCVQAS